MNTLIVYATKYGATEKCARKLTERLTGNIEMVNLKEVQDINLFNYDKVIVGGSIYAGKVRKEVNDFCTKYNETLKEKKLGLFICGMHEKEAETELKNSFSEDLLQHALTKEFFGGEFQFEKMKFMEKFIAKMVMKADKSIPAKDVTKNISTISDQVINRFAEVMNLA